jgi:hypothetical protein
MNVIDYNTIICNLKNGRLQITSDYMKKCNRLQLIMITNYDYLMSSHRQFLVSFWPCNHDYFLITFRLLFIILTYFILKAYSSSNWFFFIKSCQYSMFYTNCSWNFSLYHTYIAYNEGNMSLFDFLRYITLFF